MSSAAKVSIIIGVLSVSQLAFGEVAVGQGRRGGGGGGGWNGGGGGGRGGGGFGGPMTDEEIADRLTNMQTSLKNIDTNGNGIIEADEAATDTAANQLDRIFSRMGKDPHYPIAIADILKDYEANLRGRNTNRSTGGPTPAASTSSGTASGSDRGSRFGYVGGLPSQTGTATPAVQSIGGIASASDPKPAAKKPARFLTARERLPKGLPDWSLEKDVNGEGQVTMAQFTDQLDA